MKSAADVARKWARNTGGAGENYKAGIQAVTESPMEAAIRQKNAYVSGVQRAADDGKWEAGLRRTDFGTWKKNAMEVGAQRLTSGVTKATPKMEQFMAEFIPHVQAGKDKLRALPRGSLNENIARAVAMIEHNAQFRRR